MVHYDVQLIGGVVLHQGKIAEMATGEGKTLVATLPIYLNALPGKGVHVVTVNNYLSRRDAAWMGPLFQFHGLSVDCIDNHEPNSPERRAAYLADITYGTNSEFGFDYLRDNGAREAEELVQREHNYAIVDEVDSVLIDDARTPLIISGPVVGGDDRQEFIDLKPQVERIVSEQRALTNRMLVEAKKLLSEGNRDYDEKNEGGAKKLLRVFRGAPKNSALIKFLSEEDNKRLLQEAENYYMRDNNRLMPVIDEQLYYTIDERHNSIQLTDRGIAFLSQYNDDESYFIMPNIGEATAEIEHSDRTEAEKAQAKEELYRDFSIKSRRIHSINQLLKAYTLFEKDVQYVVMDGHGGETYWLEPTRCDWTTSAYYAPAVPEWIDHSNDERYNLSYISTEWRPLLARDRYINSRCNDVVFPEKRGRERQEEPRPERLLEHGSDYERLLYTPAGNTAVLGLAKQLIAQSKLGADRTTDVLNICLDSSRRIAEAYGPESIEVEDMYYRLDRDLADFLTFLFAQVEKGNVTVVLTSDHGTSPSYDMACGETDRFNARQFEVIVNGFLNVRYGTGDWVVAYNDKCVWLNHNRIYERGLNLAEVQNEVAIFAMQFRGVSHALSATAMRSSYFGSGYARRMQNSFYPRRSGDVVLNLMPGWIEEQERCRSLSGSMYGYDTEVPLVFYGTGAGQQHVGRSVDMTAVAPTLARLAGATQPAASEGKVLPEIVDL